MRKPDLRIDTTSLTWRAVTEAARERIAVAQARLEHPGLDPVKTEFHRGEIAAARAILALAPDAAAADEIRIESPVY